jgi:hypothetical protein
VDLPNAVSEGQGVTHMGLSLRHQSDAAAELLDMKPTTHASKMKALGIV